MKNKHMVLLFLATVSIGVIYRLVPWPVKGTPSVDLLRLDVSAVEGMVYEQAGSVPLEIDRSDSSWVLTRGTRTVAILPEAMNAIFSLLAPMEIVRIIPAGETENTGLSQPDAAQLTISFANGGTKEHLRIGRLVGEGKVAATFVELPRHGGIYLVRGDLKAAFSFPAVSFRPGNPVEIRAEALRAVGISRKHFPYCLYQYQQDKRVWNLSDSLQTDSTSFAAWLSLLVKFNEGEEAAFFDESRADETRTAVIELDMDTALLTLQLYQIDRPGLPDDPSTLSEKPPSQPYYILESSKEEGVFFALYDTALVHNVLFHLPEPPIKHAVHVPTKR